MIKHVSKPLPKQTLTSWGRIASAEQEVLVATNRFDPLLLPDGTETCLPYGNGRSYGDSCLNVSGIALKTTGLDRWIDFDQTTGIVRCEAGVLLSEILRLVVPSGWFLPVSPGTRFVTVGGAIANDVHGKNHHVAGTFGRHVRQFELLRSDGRRLPCSRSQHPEFFAATVGGLGLTGLITWAEIQLQPIQNPWIEMETIRFDSTEEFFALCQESDHDYAYTVAWIDCLSKEGRGLFMRGNHAPAGVTPGTYTARVKKFPFVPPFSMVNKLTTSVFNVGYFHQQLSKKTARVQHYEPFFYPLDGILDWNRMYGPHGFYQYQCVIPTEHALEAVNVMLGKITQSGEGSFLAVLKVCGALPSEGLLSFPMPGVSLALDFPATGPRLLQLFAQLDQIVANAKGRLYPAKDARMPASLFQSGYPRWKDMQRWIDPRFSSSFWRRVTEDS